MLGFRHLVLGLAAVWLGGMSASAERAKDAPGPKVVHVSGIFPDPAVAGLPEPVLAGLEDGAVVKLDLTLLPEVYTQLSYDSGQPYTLPAECGFGLLAPLSAVQIPTGSNHLLLTVMLGDPWLHAANRLSCEYAPSRSDETGIGAVVELKGCYLAHKLSIPTAIQLALHPLPASACGYGN